MVKQPDNQNYLWGALFGFAAASIWASWSAITRLAVTTSLGAWDIAALRYGVAGILLWPVLMQRGLALDRLGWLGLVMIIAGGGAPYALVAASGLRLAPAGSQAALNPGCVPLFVALIETFVLGEKASTPRKFGLSLILIGALIIIGWHTEAWSTSRAYGHALSLFAAFMWACFTVIMLQAKLGPVHAAAPFGIDR
jgi:drug/metabolite transporter (DMT)-like permease